MKTKQEVCVWRVGRGGGSSEEMEEDELTSVIGGCWSHLDPAVGSRVLTDDEREAAGLLQTIWPPSVGSRAQRERVRVCV